MTCKGTLQRGKREKTDKSITVIDGELSGQESIILVLSGNDFESIRNDRHIVRIERSFDGRRYNELYFCIIIDGMMYATQH